MFWSNPNIENGLIDLLIFGWSVGFDGSSAVSSRPSSLAVVSPCGRPQIQIFLSSFILTEN